MSFVTVKNLTKHFPIQQGFFRKTVGYVKALTDVSFSIEKGQVLGVVGESGSGKSTLARTLLYLTEPSKGSVLIEGRDVGLMTSEERKELRRRLQIVFQNPAQSLNPKMTVSDSIREPLIFHNMVEKYALYHRIEELLERVGLSPHLASRYPHELSLGQKQRVAIARALSVEPEFLVLDECVSALDISVQAQILNLLLRLQEELGMTYLFISHDLSVVEHISDSILVMSEGCVVEEGTAERIFDAPQNSYTKKLLGAALAPHPRLRTIF